MASSSNNINVKRALLIGNNHYKEGNELEYSINNVIDLQVKLEKIGFNVIIGLDLICDDIEKLFEDFINEINIDDLILFFYSGYGIHYDNENYIIPIDNKQIEINDMFKYRIINIKNQLNMIINRHPSSSIFIFDCSKPYFISNKINFINYGGLSSMELLNNSLIIYSTNQNETILDKSINGRNTIFLYYLIQYIDQINLPIDEIMDIISDIIINQTNHQQIPFKISSIKKNIYFNYQIDQEINQRRKSLIEQLICSQENDLLIDLRNKQLIDRDMKIIVENVLKKKKSTRLWLNSNKITSIGASILSSGLNNNKYLERLYLNGNLISDIGLKYISKALLNNNTLKILGLQLNQITDLGIEYLSEMIQINKTLTSIWLDQNQITDKSIQIISNSLKNSYSSIQYLDFSKNKLITDLSIHYIIEIIQSNKTINEISLYDCNLSNNAKEKLRKIVKLNKKFTIYLNSWNE